jgi:hypothetical protein
LPSQAHIGHSPIRPDCILARAVCSYRAVTKGIFCIFVLLIIFIFSQLIFEKMEKVIVIGKKILDTQGVVYVETCHFKASSNVYQDTYVTYFRVYPCTALASFGWDIPIYLWMESITVNQTALLWKHVGIRTPKYLYIIHQSFNELSQLSPIPRQTDGRRVYSMYIGFPQTTKLTIKMKYCINLRYLFLFGYIVVQYILRCVFALFVFVLCTLCWQFLWIVHLWLPLRFSLTFTIATNITHFFVLRGCCNLSFMRQERGILTLRDTYLGNHKWTIQR